MKHEEMIAVIRAHADGKDIQVKRKVPGSKWRPASTPCWDFSVFDYRVMPEPFECWITVNSSPNEPSDPNTYLTKLSAERNVGTVRKVIHMREVIEE